MVLKRTEDNGKEPDVEEILRSLSELSDGSDPDKPFSRETKSALGYLAGIMEEAEREFRDGTVAVNPEELSKMREAALFFKRIAGQYGGKITKIDLEPHLRQSCVRFHTDSMILSGADLMDFADLVESLGTLEITPDLDGGIDIDLSVKGLWRKVEDAQ